MNTTKSDKARTAKVRARLGAMAAELGRLGGAAARGASKVRGDSDHYRAIRAKRQPRTLGGVRVLRTRVHESGGLYRWAIWTEGGKVYRDGGNYSTRERAKAGLRAALDAR